VNAVVGAVNTMIKGLNKISDVLPGINFHIDLIPQLAKGGPIQSRRVGGGFKTSGARAIVGEGKASHPEFVIPTDPTYKKRAQGLLALAGQKLGMHVSSDPTNKGVAGDSIKDMTRVLAARGETPMFASGGVLGAISGALGATKDMVKGASSWVKGNIKKLASTPFAAFKALAQDKINKIGWPPARGVANKAMQLATSFTVGADAALAHKAGDIKKAQKRAAMAAEAARAGTYNGKLSNNARVKRAQIFAKSQVGDPYVWGGVGPNGFDCSGFMSAITNVLMGRSPYSRVGATSSFPWGGFGGGYDPAGFTIGSTNNYGGSGVGHMAGTLGGMNVESRGGHGVIVGSGARGWNDPGFNTYGHLLGLQSGGIIKASRYGTVARIGEGGRDEAVTPLPRGWRNNVPGNTDSGTKKEYHFHGVTFQFPSVKNDEDAQAFLDRLEILVKD
jgi:cell wall-associated NlpC family hydrolase